MTVPHMINRRAAMFDEEPDGDPHGECATEIARLQELVRWAYSKLHSRTFSTQEDALKLDEMKLQLEHGAHPDGMTLEDDKRFNRQWDVK